MEQILKLLRIMLVSLCAITLPAWATSPEKLSPNDSDYQQILSMTKDYYRAWSYTREDTRYDDAGRYYDKAPNNVFWDPLPPLGGHRGWQEYQHVIKKVWLPMGMTASGILYAQDNSFQAWRFGDVVWAISNCLIHAEFTNGHSQSSSCRGTMLWTKKTGQWLVAHEQFSAPQLPNANIFKGQRASKDGLKVNQAFLARARAVAAQWGDGPLTEASKRLAPYYWSENFHLYAPWPPHNGYHSQDSLTAGLQEYMNLIAERFSLQINDDLEANIQGDIAWTSATVNMAFQSKNGEQFQGNGRQSLIWIQQNGEWRIIHEHLSLPVAGAKN